MAAPGSPRCSPREASDPASLPPTRRTSTGSIPARPSGVASSRSRLTRPAVSSSARSAAAAARRPFSRRILPGSVPYRALYEARVRLAGCGSSLLAWATSVLRKAQLRSPPKSAAENETLTELLAHPPSTISGAIRSPSLYRLESTWFAGSDTLGEACVPSPWTVRLPLRLVVELVTGAVVREDGVTRSVLHQVRLRAAPAVPKTRTASPPLGGPAERQRKRSKFWADTLSLFACRFVPPRTALSGSAS
jgi:hypothetical protein